METNYFIVNIPQERIGVLIGQKGSVKKTIEERLNVKLEIDSLSGSVKIELDRSAGGIGDPISLFKAKDIVEAIGRGFSPEKAFRLFSENGILSIINIDDYVKHSRSNLIRIRARLIGQEGKTRRIVEETTDTYISIYGDTVAIIGESEEDVRSAEEAIISLIRGAPHTSVYRFLNNYARTRKLRIVRK
ncbi:MAG: KH domain-containing protein [Candidatus Caldarchaeales archaeon]